MGRIQNPGEGRHHELSMRNDRTWSGSYCLGRQWLVRRPAAPSPPGLGIQYLCMIDWPTGSTLKRILRILRGTNRPNVYSSTFIRLCVSCLACARLQSSSSQERKAGIWAATGHEARETRYDLLSKDEQIYGTPPRSVTVCPKSVDSAPSEVDAPLSRTGAVVRGSANFFIRYTGY